MWGVQWCGAAEVSEPVVCTRSQTHCDEHTDVKVADEPSGRGCGTCTDICASSNETSDFYMLNFFSLSDENTDTC